MAAAAFRLKPEATSAIRQKPEATSAIRQKPHATSDCLLDSQFSASPS